MDIKITREEHRRIKRMDKAEFENFLNFYANKEVDPIEKEIIRKEALLDARIALEKAIDIKGIGGMRKAAIRERYREVMKERENERRET